MTLHINNPELEKQLKKFAKETEQSVELLADNFLKQGFDIYKNNPAHVTETLARWNEYEKTGKSISNEEVRDYLQTLGTKQ